MKKDKKNDNLSLDLASERKKSIRDINVQIDSLSRAIVVMKMKLRQRSLENVSQIKKSRRDIARLKTIIAEKVR